MFLQWQGHCTMHNRHWPQIEIPEIKSADELVIAETPAGLTIGLDGWRNFCGSEQNLVFLLIKKYGIFWNCILRFTLLVVVIQFLLPLVVIIILYYRIYVYLKVDWKLTLTSRAPRIGIFVESQIAIKKLPERPAEDKQDPVRHQPHLLSQVGSLRAEQRISLFIFLL